jgi:hypothetical protein
MDVDTMKERIQSLVHIKHHVTLNLPNKQMSHYLVITKEEPKMRPKKKKTQKWHDQCDKKTIHRSGTYFSGFLCMEINVKVCANVENERERVPTQVSKDCRY